jgi:hypothetical protein
VHGLVLFVVYMVCSETFKCFTQQESKITREEMVKMMIIIIGEKILLEALKKLHYCVSSLCHDNIKCWFFKSSRCLLVLYLMSASLYRKDLCHTMLQDSPKVTFWSLNAHCVYNIKSNIECDRKREGSFLGFKDQHLLSFVKKVIEI